MSAASRKTVWPLIVTARLVARRAAQPPTLQNGLSWRVHDVTALLRSPMVRRWPHLVPPNGTFFEHFSDDLKEIDRGSLIERSERLVLETDDEDLFGTVQFASGRMHVFTSQANHGKVTSLIETEARPRSRMIAVDLDIVELPRQRLPEVRRCVGADGTLPGDWYAVIEGTDTSRSRYSVVGLAGEVHGLRHATMQTLVVDVEQVSGGTGFAIVEQSDPITAPCGDGLDLRLRVDLSSDPRRPRSSRCGRSRLNSKKSASACEEPRLFLRGDVDQNGRIDISDAVSILRGLFSGAEPPPCARAADTDDNGALGVTDAVVLLRHLFVDATPAPALIGCVADGTPPRLFSHSDR